MSSGFNPFGNSSKTFVGMQPSERHVSRGPETGRLTEINELIETYPDLDASQENGMNQSNQSLVIPQVRYRRQSHTSSNSSSFISNTSKNSEDPNIS